MKGIRIFRLKISHGEHGGHKEHGEEGREYFCQKAMRELYAKIINKNPLFPPL